jgi:hypothetical protein
VSVRSRDYEEFLESFHRNDVRYLIVGAHAVAFHARPRATKDLDLFEEPTVENAERILRAIRDRSDHFIALAGRPQPKVQRPRRPGMNPRAGIRAG